MNWAKKTILITGGSGFLGRYIVEQLLALSCKAIRSYSRYPQPELKKMGIEVICGDISDLSSVTAACDSCDIVFHTAAKAGIWGSYRDFYNTNVQGTANIIEACEKGGVPILVNTSSPSVVSTEGDIINGDETLPIPEKFLSHYPATKAEAEKMVTKATSCDLRTISLRPHLIWGPRDPHILPRLFARAKAKRLIRIGDGTNRVDLTYIENAACAHIKAAEMLSVNPEISGKSYFISDDSPVLLWSWINEMLKKMNLPSISRAVSYQKARAMGSAMEIIFRILHLSKEPPITRFTAAQLAHSHFFNISAAKKDLKYTPIISQEEAIIKTTAYFSSKI